MITCRHRRRRTLILTRCSSVRHFEYFNQNRPPDKPSLACLLLGCPLPASIPFCAGADWVPLSLSLFAWRGRCASPLLSTPRSVTPTSPGSVCWTKSRRPLCVWGRVGGIWDGPADRSKSNQLQSDFFCLFCDSTQSRKRRKDKPVRWTHEKFIQITNTLCSCWIAERCSLVRMHQL